MKQKEKPNKNPTVQGVVYNLKLSDFVRPSFEAKNLPENKMTGGYALLYK